LLRAHHSDHGCARDQCFGNAGSQGWEIAREGHRVLARGVRNRAGDSRRSLLLSAFGRGATFSTAVSLAPVPPATALLTLLRSLSIAVAIASVLVGALGQAAAQLGVVEAVTLGSILQVSGLLVLTASVMWAGWRALKARYERSSPHSGRRPRAVVWPGSAGDHA